MDRNTVLRVLRIIGYAVIAYIAVALTFQYVEVSSVTRYFLMAGLIFGTIEIIDWLTPDLNIMTELRRGNTAVGIATAGVAIACAIVVHAL